MRTHFSIAAFGTLALLIAASAGAAQAPDTTASAFPLNIMKDEGRIILYVNEEPLITDRFTWLPTGAFTSEYVVSVGGQSVTTSFSIEVDAAGLWRKIDMITPQGPVTATRDGAKVSVKVRDQVRSLDLRPGTILFENFSPALMSQAVAAYDQGKGGKQTFPLFIIPAVVMDASLERLGVAERFVGGEPRAFTLYRYYLPGVDVTVWVDKDNKVCLGDVPAQHAAYVREGYEALRIVEEPDSLLSKPRYEVAVEKNVMIPMRDGVKLATDLYKPAAEGTYPVILTRTPYSKDMSELTGRFYARRGYVFAIQDCRGRFGSGGAWNPFFKEPQDGYDTIEWLSAQPWSTGKVGMIGGSYLGWVQWWAAREAPPHLAAIIPNVSPPVPFFNIPYEYGVFYLLGAIWWADVLEEEATADLSGKAMAAIGEKKYAKLLKRLPVVDLDQSVLGKRNSYWREWIDHPANDAYWARASFLNRLKGFKAPVYHQSGWFDGDGIGTKLNYEAMARDGHQMQKLVLGPWGHTDTAMRTGPNERDFGPNAIVDLSRSYLRWLDRWLKGVENGVDREPLVSLFVMNTDKWLTGPSYPLPETKLTKMYLASGGKANTSRGDGRLVAEAPAGGAAFDGYVYDPGDPTPDPNFQVSRGDTAEKAAADSLTKINIDAARAFQLAFYAGVDSARADILVYETEPLADSLVIAGPVSAVLYASTSGKDTDWIMRLSEVDEKGQVFPLVHGVIRARFRESFSSAKLLKPGEIYEYRLDMWQTGITIPKGRKLRVEVASAAFPTFSRNLNTGGHNETEKKFVKATQRVYHEGAHASYVLLPVIEKPVFKDKPW